MAEKLVLDASFAIKWFVGGDEQHTEMADAILADLLAKTIEVHVPRLFFYEMASILARACANQERAMTPDEALASLDDLFELPLVVFEGARRETSESVRLATEHSKTAYDMSYLFLAGELDCQWCTADEKVAKGQGERFPRSRIQLLAERA